MRRRGKGKLDIIIDLTALLDVIFILLMVVLSESINKTEILNSQQQEAQNQQASATAEYNLYQDQLEIYDNYILSVSVDSSFVDEDWTKRTIHMLNRGDEIKTYELIGNDISALDTLRMDIVDLIEKSDSSIIVLSLNEDDEKILYRDEKAISKIMDELKEEYESVYIK